MAKKPVKAAAKKNVRTKSTIKPDRTFLITGHVTDLQTGVGVAGLPVKVIDKDGQYEQFLKSTTTGEQGYYEVSVNASQIGKYEKGGPDIIVKVFDKEGKEGKELAASEVVYNATAKTTINLSVTLHREPELSEYETLIVTLTPILPGKQIVDLSNAEISELSKKSGIDQKRIELLVQSAKLSREIGLPTEALYGLARLDISIELKSLLELTPNRVRTALETSINKNLVPSILSDKLDDIMHQFESLQRRHMPVNKLAEAIGLEIPAATAKVLESLNIRTLSDVRSAGGFANIKELHLNADDPLVKKGDAYVNLDLLGTDIPTNKVLIDEGFSHISHVAKEPRDLFVKQMTPMLGEARAERLQIIASAQTSLLENQLINWQVKNANGFDKNTEKTKKDSILKSSLPDKCGCEDCDAAVSPLAYLADLMGYAITGLRDNDQPISFDYLTKQFCQPFSDLPVACEQMYQEVRQVRLCIEVLQRAPKLLILSPAAKALPGKLAAYRQDAYERLLSKLGGSYVDLRAAHGATTEARTALADRLGIPLGSTAPDNLDTLQLDLSTATELDLEKLFGLVDTRRDPLCSCSKSGDTDSQVVRWKWSGVKWGINTDLDGRVFLRISKPGTKYKVEAFSGAARTTDQLEASGEADSTTATIVLEPVANISGLSNGLSGELSLAFKPILGDPIIVMQVVPLVQSWRLQKLRTQWQAQDWITDRYLPSAGEQQLPIIDPDLIGPDDFRMPVAKTNPSDPDKAFDIWIKRRNWMDALLAVLRTNTLNAATGTVSTAAIGNLFAFMQTTTYDGISKSFWSAAAATEISVLNTTISQSADKEAVATAKADLWSLYKLTPESLKRLLDIKKKYDASIYDAIQFPAVTEDEWQEVISILAQAQKTFWFNEKWIQEESTAALVFGPNEFWFGPKEFWMSEREPKEDEWPPTAPGTGVPRIDPETLKREELADQSTGKTALALWDARASELREFRNILANIVPRDMSGANSRITTALSAPSAPTIPELESYYTDLQSSTATTVAAAKLHIANLRFIDEDFKKVMLLRKRLDSTLVPIPPKPTDAEWAEMEKILTNVHRVRTLWPIWATADTDPATGFPKLKDWQILKIRMPKWRSTSEDRQAWHRALQARSAAPLIDPDLLQEGHFRARYTNEAKTIYDARAGVEQSVLIIGSGTTDRDGLEQRMTVFLGPFVNDDLADLISDMLQDGVSDARLDQLTITRAEITFLVRMHGLLAETIPQTLTQKEWDSIASILTQVWKRRQYSEWRSEEQDSSKKLTASPDWFKLPEVDTTKFPPKPLPSLPEWRATRGDLLDWEDRLQSRMDQEAALFAGLQNAIGEVEEVTLPSLRDALITVVCPIGSSYDVQADWFTERYLIDAKQSGCQKTNRIAQAIEALQQLLWSVRTGLLTDSYPNLKLVASVPEVDPDTEFDEKWKWIGSYATWRAAMFVFLYPENILLPSLKKYQTPAMSLLIDNLRGIRRLTPAGARKAAKQYSNYFQDICSLSLEAGVAAKVRLTASTGQNGTLGDTEDRLFLFARSTDSYKVYWATRDATQKASTQTCWVEVTAFKARVLTLIGAVEYDIEKSTNMARYIYLFAKVRDGLDIKLVYCRYDLENNTFLEEQSELTLPDGVKDFTANLRTTATAEDAPYNVAESPIIYIQSGEIEYIGHLNQKGDDWSTETRKYTFPFAEWSNAQLGVDEKCTAVFKADNVTDWIRKAHQEAQNQGFAAGFPNFNKSGTDCGIIKLTANAAYAAVYPISDLGISDPATIEGIAKRFKDINIKAASQGYAYGFPNFQDDSLNYGVVWIKVEAAYSEQVAFSKKMQDACDFALRFTQVDDPTKWKPSGMAGGFPSFMLQPNPADTGNDLVVYIKESEQRVKAISSPIPTISESLNILPVQDQLYKPSYAGSYDIRPPRYSIDGAEINKVYKQDNQNAPQSLLAYLEEAWYFVPVHIALQLQRSGDYVAALDWFRLVYDYTKPADKRSLVGLAPLASATTSYARDQHYDWLLDPLNPHSIARTRANTYLRYTLLATINCLLDGADLEFTQDTPESVPRARELYMTALQLLNSDGLKQRLGLCEDVIGEFEITVGRIWSELSSETEELPQIDYGKMKAEGLEVLQRNLEELYVNPQLDKTVKFDLAKKAVELAKNKVPPVPPRLEEKLSLNATLQKQLISGVLADREIASVVEAIPHSPMFGSGPEKTTLAKSTLPELPARVPETDKQKIPINSPSFSVNVVILLPPMHLGLWKPAVHNFCIPPNPVLRSLNLRANLNLYKLRTCRNIAGMKRQLEIFAAPTDTHTGMPVIGAGGQLVLPGLVRFQPTPYRYQVLLDRAKQLVQLAMQREQAFLSAMEKTDAEAYSLLKARQDLRLSKAGVQLQKLRVTEAVGGVKLAGLQKDRAGIQVNTYDEWINAGINMYELNMIYMYTAKAIAQAVAIAANTAVAAQKEEKWWNMGLVILGGAGNATSAVLENAIGQNNIWASQERRKQEWELQKSLAEQDERIGDQQISMAEDHVRVAEQESTIAEMQSDNAKEVVDFLTNKFTNKELYDWMSGILERVYGFFLQQATATAQLAQNQLGFERQETPPAHIQADYWEAPSDDAGNGKTPDRRGLTGSARLLQDIYQLDQYAFDTNKRKQQLTKTISLAQLDPFAFQRFRETGILTFATPMELFDRDFPGHYLRLIKRVRISVVALIPPSQGIRATLSSTGLSRVVIGGNMFQKITLRRDPETVALSSPVNATGLFELDAQTSSEMLLPHEGNGVDMAWEFTMLKASNPIDYSTTADILFTMEYTALNSFDYRQEVIQSPALNRPLSADRSFSFRQQFADAWYDLHNPDQSASPMRVTFETSVDDFPPNLSNLKVQHVLMYFASSSDKAVYIEGVELRFTANGQLGSAGGSANTSEEDGVISTRRGTASAWNSIIGKASAGTWELKLPTGSTVKALFDNTKKDHIADILFVITYSGRTPEWPL